MFESDNDSKSIENESLHASLDAFVSDINPKQALDKAKVIFDPMFTGLVALLSIAWDIELIPLFNESGISTIASHVKNGKTKLVWMLTEILALKMHQHLFVSHLEDGARVAIFDSEQGRDRVQRSVNKYFPEEKGKRIDVFSIRHLSPREMFIIIEHYINVSPKTRIVFIDIGTDLVAGGVNDLAESMYVLNAIQGLAEKFRVHFCLSIHLNKTTGEATGHYGSLLLKRSEIVITVKKQAECFVVKPLVARDLPFDPFAFTLKDGMAVPVEFMPLMAVKKINKSDFKKIEPHIHKEVLLSIFRNHKNLKPAAFKSVLRDEYGKRIGSIGILLTRELLRFYVNEGYVKKKLGFVTMNFPPPTGESGQDERDGLSAPFHGGASIHLNDSSIS
ncbi:MAG TPA: hypothetical protein PK325_01430 [Cyclobacteriaceae bacterium]|nr:hypothetical protein [Cyclobacteriaceae bacterium]HMV08069.1 hypothetical protein [Cyclobacteriaceae bacterium]HMV88285.1 hypothetical protein [Cyclobacteriaceae bacterium]HMX00710.1 hypothetical protein [Cyclobacteriaceae bacterium]HMX49415.1 hypothetical protein [Cyclobacteriaceae bacterium]